MELSLTAVIYDASGIVFGAVTGLRIIPGAGLATDLIMAAGARGREWLLPLCHVVSCGENCVCLREELLQLLDLMPYDPAPATMGPAPLLAPTTAATLRPRQPVRARDGGLGRLQRAILQPRTGQLQALVVQPGAFAHGPEMTIDWDYVAAVGDAGVQLKLTRRELRALREPL
jgi:hypothetical protein